MAPPLEAAKNTFGSGVRQAFVTIFFNAVRA
jgi:hypothetical protein